MERLHNSINDLILEVIIVVLTVGLHLMLLMVHNETLSRLKLANNLPKI
jgi:hypothetical protein